MTRDLASLAAVWQALFADARRAGLTPAALIASRFGPVPTSETETETETLTLTPTLTPTLTVAWAPLPDPTSLIESFASLHDLDTTRFAIHPGETSRTHTVAPGIASATYARGADPLSTLALALHEAGHALLRSHSAPPHAPDPPRWLDEAAAAWAVRALEDPRLIADPAIRAESRRRRLRRESITTRLAAFESAVIAEPAIDPTISILNAFPADLDPAHFPALFDEPGVMAAYAAADRWPRRILPRKVRP